MFILKVSEKAEENSINVTSPLLEKYTARYGKDFRLVLKFKHFLNYFFFKHIFVIFQIFC